MSEIKLGGVAIRSVHDADVARRISMLLWGPSGCGKTTLAATAPGRKLWINFDPDGTDSISQYPDIDVVDLSDSSDSIMDQFKRSDSPLGLKSVVDQYDTFIVDSMTNAAYKGLMVGVSSVRGATIERPSPGAYQYRNALALQLTKNMLRFTSKHKKHCIIICHEAAPVTNDEGMVLFITLMLGGQLPEQASLDFSEVWNMTDTGKERRIAIRPVRQRKPMKSRMFEMSGAAEFIWKYNADSASDREKGPGIATWYEAWKANKFQKIPVPASPKQKEDKT